MKRLTSAGIAVASLMTLSTNAAAEIQPLTDDALRSTVGQAGVTIDLSANVDIAEVAYKDQGYLFINDISLGGAGPVQAALGRAVTQGSALDNLRITIDVAGPGGSDLAAPWGLAKFNSPSWSASADNQGDHGETAISIDDGDLVIGIGAQNQAQALDFGLQIDRVGLGASSMLPGQGASNPSEQIIMDNVLLTGFLGPTDIVVDGSSNNININSYFSLDGSLRTDLYVPILLDWQEVSFDFRLHNERGEDVLKFIGGANETLSFAHVQADISPSSRPDGGLRVNITDFSGDIDTTNIAFANDRSIGSVYWTDVQIQADLDIYGH